MTQTHTRGIVEECTEDFTGTSGTVCMQARQGIQRPHKWSHILCKVHGHFRIWLSQLHVYQRVYRLSI